MRFADIWRCARGGFRRVESDVSVENEEKLAPEVKIEEKLNIQNFRFFFFDFYFFGICSIFGHKKIMKKSLFRQKRPF